jgi:nicotinamidase-related amidase
MIDLCANAALIVDLQQGSDPPRWGNRNNPQAEPNIARLLASWRQSGWLVTHVHHQSASPVAAFRRGEPGILTEPKALPANGERLYWKTVNSALIGTSLEPDLRQGEISTLVVVGLTTNHCVLTTVRRASELAFETFVVSDATATFDCAGLNGRIRSADEVHASALSDLHEELGTVAGTNAFSPSLPSSQPASV